MELRRRKRIRAALLIEALVSFGLMFTVAITVMGLQAHARQARAKGRNLVAATCLARTALEQARAGGYDQLSFGDTSRTETVPLKRKELNLAENFLLTQSVRTGPLDNLKSVLITVKWNSGEVSIEGYVGR